MNPVASPSAASQAAAFPELSEQDQRRLQRFAVRFLGCDHLAQDALQEALLSLSQQPEPPAHPVAWLLRALVHRCRHLRRTLRRRRNHEHRASSHCHLHGDCDNPLHVAIAHEVGETLAAVKDSLPREQRVALDLYESGGQDYRGIAVILGVPVGTVRSRLSRARQALRTALTG